MAGLQCRPGQSAACSIQSSLESQHEWKHEKNRTYLVSSQHLAAMGSWFRLEESH
jgi:hypothetical protein